jgi:DNA-binding response OmpR family regulator
METHTILIIDDDISLRGTLREALTLGGFAVLEASTGEEGLRIAFEKKPSLIILDLMMPQMNGYQVLAKIRKDVWGKEVKVILLTALDSLTNIAQGVDLSSSAYLIKSEVTLESIIKTVNYHLFGYEKK